MHLEDLSILSWMIALGIQGTLKWDRIVNVTKNAVSQQFTRSGESRLANHRTRRVLNGEITAHLIRNCPANHV